MARPKKPTPSPSTSPPAPLTPKTTSQFEKDAKQFPRRGKDLAKLEAVVHVLCSRRPLAPSHQDHALKGTWRGFRDCHIEPDWVLIYEVIGDELHLVRTGTHSDLFEQGDREQLRAYPESENWQEGAHLAR